MRGKPCTVNRADEFLEQQVAHAQAKQVKANPANALGGL